MNDHLPMSVCLLVSSVFVGCHSRAKPVPVSGLVKLSGNPLPNVAVTFVPIDEGRPAVGTCDDSGRFSLRCDGRDGALPGKYNVAVNLIEVIAVSQSPDGLSPPRAPGQSVNQSVSQSLPARYGDPDKSGLTVEVKAEMKLVELILTND